MGFAIQFFLNMEIERYTLATGESAITGFTRYWKPWWWLFVVFALLQNFWPGWATGAATTATFMLNRKALPKVLRVGGVRLADGSGCGC